MAANNEKTCNPVEKNNLSGLTHFESDRPSLQALLARAVLRIEDNYQVDLGQFPISRPRDLATNFSRARSGVSQSFYATDALVVDRCPSLRGPTSTVRSSTSRGPGGRSRLRNCCRQRKGFRKQHKQSQIWKETLLNVLDDAMMIIEGHVSSQELILPSTIAGNHTSSRPSDDGRVHLTEKRGNPENYIVQSLIQADSDGAGGSNAIHRDNQHEEGERLFAWPPPRQILAGSKVCDNRK